MGFGDQFRKEVKVKLDDAAVSERKNRVCHVDREILNVQADKAQALGEHNGRLKELRDEHRKLLTAIETGVETVEVDVLERVNERRGEVETVRCDTGEVIPELTRPLTSEERQLTFDDTGKPRKKRGRKAQDDGAEAEA